MPKGVACSVAYAASCAAPVPAPGWSLRQRILRCVTPPAGRLLVPFELVSRALLMVPPVRHPEMGGGPLEGAQGARVLQLVFESAVSWPWQILGDSLCGLPSVCAAVPCGRLPLYISVYHRTSGKAFAIEAWRLPAALEGASSFFVYEPWVCALCPVYQGSSVSYT
jgi:hypothetical protein